MNFNFTKMFFVIGGQNLAPILGQFAKRKWNKLSLALIHFPHLAPATYSCFVFSLARLITFILCDWITSLFELAFVLRPATKKKISDSSRGIIHTGC